MTIEEARELKEKLELAWKTLLYTWAKLQKEGYQVEFIPEVNLCVGIVKSNQEPKVAVTKHEIISL